MAAEVKSPSAGSTLPTLLEPGKLADPVTGEFVTGPAALQTPVEFITTWIKTRMAEFGSKLPANATNRILVVKSETGSGKSTVLPVSLFRILRSEKERRQYAGPSVLCTQPRVLTAKDLARNQVTGGARARATPGGAAGRGHYPDMVYGETVGVLTGPFKERPVAGLIFSTVGILAQQLKVLPDDDIMSMWKIIIVDEAHERSKEVDLTLLKLKSFYRRNEGNAKLPFLVLASATIDTSAYTRYFGVPAENSVYVRGRAYPVKVTWPSVGTNDYLRSAVETVLRVHADNPADPPARADILVFLPGLAEIAAVELALNASNPPERPFLVLPIDRGAVNKETAAYRLVTLPADQLPFVSSSNARGVRATRRVVLSTVVAETGLTINSLKYVVDCGWYRSKETYQPFGVTGLITKPAAQSRIAQRRGRAGRLFPGEFLPLYTEAVHDQLDKQQLPDVAVSGMADVFLHFVQEQFEVPRASSRAELTDHSAAARDFFVDKIDLLSDPPAEAALGALAECVALGMCTPSRVTEMGARALRTGSGVSPRALRTVLASFVWRSSVRDAVTLAVAAEFPLKALIVAPDAKSAAVDAKSVAVDAKSAAVETTAQIISVLKECLPGYFLDAPDSGSESKDGDLHFLRLRFLVCDELLESLLVLNRFAEIADGAAGDPSVVVAWCEAHGLDMGALASFAARRDEVIDGCVMAGVDPFWGEEHRLTRACPQNAFLRRVAALKKCVYDGNRAGLLRLVDGRYVTQAGVHVKVPQMFAEEELLKLRRWGEAEVRRPEFVVAAALELALKRKPPDAKDQQAVYEVRARGVSAMSGFVSVDPLFARPRECGDAASGDAALGNAALGNAAPGSTGDEKALASAYSRLNLYQSLCAASLPKQCPPFHFLGKEIKSKLFPPGRANDNTDQNLLQYLEVLRCN